jgi:hypothetical protein
MFWVDALGYAASASVLATFCMNRMVPLRVVAICSNVLFAAFGGLAHINPVLVLHVILLPINTVRLIQVLVDIQEPLSVTSALMVFAPLIGVIRPDRKFNRGREPKRRRTGQSDRRDSEIDPEQCRRMARVCDWKAGTEVDPNTRKRWLDLGRRWRDLAAQVDAEGTVGAAPRAVGGMAQRVPVPNARELRLIASAGPRSAAAGQSR